MGVLGGLLRIGYGDHTDKETDRLAIENLNGGFEQCGTSGRSNDHSD